MPQFYAQPYDIGASGFFFSSRESYEACARTCRNACGGVVEEFDIQFIDGESLDAAFADAFGINQANVFRFMELCEDWDDHAKRRFIIAVGECGYRFDPNTVSPDDFEVDVYEVESLKDLAAQFVDEGLSGEIPEHLRPYLDMDAIARDLGMEYSETEIDGVRLVYACR